MKLSPKINFPKPLRGSEAENKLIIFFGETLLVDSLCSARYLIRPILG